MPELPEVETMRRRLLPILGTIVVSAARTPCFRKPISIRPRIDVLNRRIANRTIVAVDRLGKRVVLRFDCDHRLIFEPRMTGIVLAGTPPNREHLRFELKLRQRGNSRGVPPCPVLFWDRRGLGRIELVTPQQFEVMTGNGTGNGKLGPDAIAVSKEELYQRARTSRREVKVALLDQKLIAGIGNLYASEILHCAGVDPRSRCDRLTKRQWAGIHQAMQQVLESAIAHEGSTLSDGTYQKALDDPGSYQNQHRVYDRAELHCPTCGKASIRRIVQAQRSTFHCPRCQKKQ